MLIHESILSGESTASKGIVGAFEACAKDMNTCNVHRSGHSSTTPLSKLNRINQGGEIRLNGEHIIIIESDARTTTVHMRKGQLFDVEETPAVVADVVERLESARIKNATVESGLGGKAPL